MTEPETIVFPGCKVLYWRLGHHIQTVFPDGLKVDAAANYDADSLQRARDLGYDSSWEMSRDHELIHSIIAEARGEPYSRVLRGVAVRDAGGRKEDIITPAESAEEEALVLDVQRWIRTNVLSRRLAESTLDREALAARLREMTDA